MAATSIESSGRPVADPKWMLWAAKFGMGVAVAGLAAVAVIELLQPDRLAAITAVPPWSWLLVWCAIGFPGVLSSGKPTRWIAALIVAIFLLTTVEQTWSVARRLKAILLPLPVALHEIRVVTHNCNIGSSTAAAEAVAFAPDVLLLQESPSRQSAEQLARQLYDDEAAIVWSADCSILARGELSAVSSERRTYVQATWTRPDGQIVEIICTRLSPPVVRYDLWSAGCWEAHWRIRRKHRREVNAIAAAIAKVPVDRPVLIGGDMNAPSGDGALKSFSPRLTDAFRTAGYGWGATVLNELPVHRFDQLWCSQQFEPRSVRAVFSNHSDHRLVVGDLRLARRED